MIVKVEDLLYNYAAEVERVYDGDSIYFHIDLGMHTWRGHQMCRLLGINAPEVRGKEREEGLKVRDWVRGRLPVGKIVRLKTHKDKTGKYGRWLVEIYIDNSPKSLNEEMLELGLAKPYKPKSRR